MESFPKRQRGRPRKLPEPEFQEERQRLAKEPREVREIVREMLPFGLPSERTAANRYYANRARDVVAGLSKGLRMPEDPVRAANLRVGMDWVLARSTVLTELGRMLVDEPSDEDVARFQSALMYVAGKRPNITAKEAAAYVRSVRLGHTKKRDRLRAFYRELEGVISAHLARHPDTTVEDALRVLDLARQQVEKKYRR
jgi:hypothetical protein